MEDCLFKWIHHAIFSAKLRYKIKSLTHNRTLHITESATLIWNRETALQQFPAVLSTIQ